MVTVRSRTLQASNGDGGVRMVTVKGRNGDGEGEAYPVGGGQDAGQHMQRSKRRWWLCTNLLSIPKPVPHS
jgi:hypothetical protein